jgi:Tetratricopeptide repeat
LLQENLVVLAARAGQVVVDAAVADGWDTAHFGIAQLLGRGDDSQIRLIEQRLEETRKQLDDACGTDVGMIRTIQTARWTGRLADFLEENPDAEADLRTLIHKIRTVPADQKSPASPRTAAVNGHARIHAGGVPGSEHPSALAARSELAYSAGQAGDTAGARDQFASLLPVTERVLGPEHPDTLTCRNNLANFAGYAGNADAARDHFAVLVPVSERVSGAESSDALTARFNLGYWTGRAGDAAAARDHFAALVPVRERVSGPDDPETLAAREELAYWTGQAGDAAGARDQFASLLLVRERVHGPEHAETMAVWYQLAHWTAVARDAGAAPG